MFASWRPRGTLAPRALEQIGLLALLTEDGDDEVRSDGRGDARRHSERVDCRVPRPVGRSRGAAGVFPRPRHRAAAGRATPATSRWSTPRPALRRPKREEEEDDQQSITQKLALLGVAERMKAAMKGSKSERAILIRDPNKLVSAAVLSSPKLTDSEVENFAKLANVSEEILRTIGMNRGWIKNYGVVAALTKNPKTPLAVSMRFVQRLNDRDLKMIALDRNLQEPLKLAVRKRIAEGQEKK